MLQYNCFVALYNFKLTNANSIKLLYKITLINILFSGQNLFSLVNEDGEIIPNHLMQTGLLLYTDKTVLKYFILGHPMMIKTYLRVRNWYFFEFFLLMYWVRKPSIRRKIDSIGSRYDYDFISMATSWIKHNC